MIFDDFKLILVFTCQPSFRSLASPPWYHGSSSGHCCIVFSRFCHHRIHIWALKVALYPARWIPTFHMQYAIVIGSNFNIKISKGSVKTHLRWDGESWYYVNRISSGIWQWKNFGNQSIFAEVKIKSKVYCFLRQCTSGLASCKVEIAHGRATIRSGIASLITHYANILFWLSNSNNASQNMA